MSNSNNSDQFKYDDDSSYNSINYFIDNNNTNISNSNFSGFPGLIKRNINIPNYLKPTTRNSDFVSVNTPLSNVSLVNSISINANGQDINSAFIQGNKYRVSGIVIGGSGGGGGGAGFLWVKHQGKQVDTKVVAAGGGDGLNGSTGESILFSKTINNLQSINYDIGNGGIGGGQSNSYQTPLDENGNGSILTENKQSTIIYVDTAGSGNKGNSSSVTIIDGNDGNNQFNITSQGGDGGIGGKGAYVDFYRGNGRNSNLQQSNRGQHAASGNLSFNHWIANNRPAGPAISFGAEAKGNIDINRYDTNNGYNNYLFESGPASNFRMMTVNNDLGDIVKSQNDNGLWGYSNVSGGSAGLGVDIVHHTNNPFTEFWYISPNDPANSSIPETPTPGGNGSDGYIKLFFQKLN